MKKRYIGIKEYAEEFNLPEATVRAMTKRENPPFEIEWSGNRALILVIDDKEETELRQEVKELKNLVITMCKHFGVNTDSLNFENGKAVS